jgi:hypothetical protein
MPCALLRMPCSGLNHSFFLMSITTGFCVKKYVHVQGESHLLLQGRTLLVSQLQRSGGQGAPEGRDGDVQVNLFCESLSQSCGLKNEISSSYQFKAASTVFNKGQVALSGKVGGMRDDLAILVQLAAFWTTNPRPGEHLIFALLTSASYACFYASRGVIQAVVSKACQIIMSRFSSRSLSNDATPNLSCAQQHAASIISCFFS